jgi:hypothetical protein
MAKNNNIVRFIVSSIKRRERVFVLAMSLFHVFLVYTHTRESSKTNHFSAHLNR